MVTDPNEFSYGKSRAERIIEQINASNAKKVALFMVFGFICYHELLHLRYGKYTKWILVIIKWFVMISGSNSCSWLLSDGRYKADQEWQPYGCMLHHYTSM